MSSNMESDPIYFATVARWKAWLKKNHDRGVGAWVLMAKKGAPEGLRYQEALDEALCWGWIDGKLHRHDESYYALWFSPRRPKSIWSLANTKSVARLTEAGRMRPPGLARVQEAQADGRWQKGYGAKAVPAVRPDVRAALKKGGASEAWKTTPASRRLLLLRWVEDAKRPETRARRLEELPRLVIEKRLAGFSSR